MENRVIAFFLDVTEEQFRLYRSYLELRNKFECGFAPSAGLKYLLKEGK